LPYTKFDFEKIGNMTVQLLLSHKSRISSRLLGKWRLMSFKRRAWWFILSKALALRLVLPTVPVFPGRPGFPVICPAFQPYATRDANVPVSSITGQLGIFWQSSDHSKPPFDIRRGKMIKF
jgi:hypothetical protein